MNAAAVSREAAFEAGAAIRTRGFVFDPFRGCLGLAQSAVSRGAQLFEHTEVRRVRAKKKHVEVATASGSVRAQAVVIATSAPLADLRALRRHLHHQESYAVVTEPLPAAVRRELGKRGSGDARRIAAPRISCAGSRMTGHSSSAPTRSRPGRARERRSSSSGRVS